MNAVFLKQELERFLLEDLGHIDVNVRRAAPYVYATVIAEESGTMCGGPFLVQMLEMLSVGAAEGAVVERIVDEGSFFLPKRQLLRLRAHPEVIRHGIRTGLNLLQDLSGIASNTSALVAEVRDTGCTLLDTRKTTPGFRAFEKYAVRTGGGRNHRFNRLDGVLIKKEDIRIDGGITAAVKRAVATAPYLNGIEVEVEASHELEEALSLPQVTHILLDNMRVDQVREAVKEVAGKKILEASGVPTVQLRAYAETGVPFISTSALIRGGHPLKMKMELFS